MKERNGGRRYWEGIPKVVGQECLQRMKRGKGNNTVRTSIALEREAVTMKIYAGYDNGTGIWRVDSYGGRIVGVSGGEGIFSARKEDLTAFEEPLAKCHEVSVTKKL